MYDLMNKKNCCLLDCKLNLRGEYLVKPVLIQGLACGITKKGEESSVKGHILQILPGPILDIGAMGAFF